MSFFARSNIGSAHLGGVARRRSRILMRRERMRNSGQKHSRRRDIAYGGKWKRRMSRRRNGVRRWFDRESGMGGPGMRFRWDRWARDRLYGEPGRTWWPVHGCRMTVRRTPLGGRQILTSHPFRYRFPLRRPFRSSSPRRRRPLIGSVSRLKLRRWSGHAMGERRMFKFTKCANDGALEWRTRRKF